MGLLLATGPLATGVSSPVAGALSDRFGVRRLTLAGLLILCAAYGSMRLLGETTSAAGLEGLWIPIGAGMGPIPVTQQQRHHGRCATSIRWHSEWAADDDPPPRPAHRSGRHRIDLVSTGHRRRRRRPLQRCRLDDPGCLDCRTPRCRHARFRSSWRCRSANRLGTASQRKSV